MSEMRFTSGMLVFPNLTQLDLTGPYEVLARLPGAEMLLLWKSLDPVRSEHELTILPTATLSSCPPLDLVLVTGGVVPSPCRGGGALCGRDLHRLAGARRRGSAEGRRAGTHWMSRDLLRSFGAEPAVLAAVRARAESRQRDRAERVARAAAAL